MRPEQNESLVQTFFKCIFVNETFWFSNKISFICVHRVWLTASDTPIQEPMLTKMFDAIGRHCRKIGLDIWWSRDLRRHPSWRESSNTNRNNEQDTFRAVFFSHSYWPSNCRDVSRDLGSRHNSRDATRLNAGVISINNMPMVYNNKVELLYTISIRKCIWII